MERSDRVTRGVVALFAGVPLWKRHLANLSLAVSAATRAGRLGVAAIGRRWTNRSTPKHNIKRFDRFLGNPRFGHRAAMEHMLRTVVGQRREVFIAVDWTKIRSWHVLVAAVVHRGRALPVLWAVTDPRDLTRSQNAFEHAFFTWLASSLPVGTRAVLLLDRGFKRVALAAQLEALGLGYVIRTSGTTRVEHESYRGSLDDLVRRVGVIHDLPGALLTTDRPTAVRIVGRWDRRAAEPWMVMTNLTDAPDVVLAAYGRRFEIEETFRDKKDLRFGLGLGAVRVQSAARLERLILIAALVHLLVSLVGAIARRDHLDRAYRANTPGKTHRRAHSDFTLGLYYIFRRHWRFAGLRTALRATGDGMLGG